MGGTLVVFRLGTGAETMRLGRFTSRFTYGFSGPLTGRRALGLCGRCGLEKRRQRGVFGGRMEMLFARARNEGMVRQPVLGMEALHLLKTIGAIDAATDADCPGFGHGGSALIS